MTDFRARPALLLRDVGTHACLRVSATNSLPGDEQFLTERDLLERVHAALPGGVRAARDRLERAGVGGASEVLGAMSGWVRLMEGLAEGLTPLLETEPEGRVHLRRIKEKFGTLRVHASIEGPDRFQEGVRGVIGWAVAASERRCALTGRPGVPDHAGWYLILSREAILWRATQPDAFRSAIYPQRPDPSPAPEPV